MIASLILLTTDAQARAPAPLVGTLDLDMADPVITIRVNDVPLRLRVDFDQRDVVELNTAAVSRLPLPFERGSTDNVGRVAISSLVAIGTFVLNGRTVAVTLSSHGDCCAGVDGAISPALLPYAEIRFHRAGPLGITRTFTMQRSADYGLSADQPIGPNTVRVQFSLARAESLATAAAGSIIAAAHGGRFDGGYAPTPIAFGISRPARLIAFATPVTLAGFRFDSLRTRTADFGGKHRLPRDPAEPGEILVERKVKPQAAWPAVILGRDRLDRCTDIRFRPAALGLTVTCAFDDPRG